MITRKAIAEIAVDRQRGWVLPTAGTRPFRYWAWARFQKDPTRNKNTWTLWLDFDGQPDLSRELVTATVYFVAPDAPHDVIEPDATFELYCGQVHFTHGRIKEVLPDAPTA